jgi:hypothetical protein
MDCNTLSRSQRNLNKLKYLDPRRWSIHCWLLFAFWLFVGVITNLPLGPSAAEANSPDHYLHPLLEEYGEFYGGAGWPANYLLTTYRKDATTVINQWTTKNLIWNIVLISISIFCLVLILQIWFRRFKLITFLIAVSVAAVLINATVLLARNINSAETSANFEYFVLAVYFSPIGLAAILTTSKLIAVSVNKYRG